ncbi:MAG: TldD/PmbA family protein [Asgard group archaeon]|nr:TldD/PmbA family protein [Asgard group archaeon]
MLENMDIADYVVEYGTKKGASYIEARLIDTRLESYNSRNGALFSGGVSTMKGIGIRLIVDGGVGFCSTAKLEKANIDKIINDTLKMAKASKRKEPIVFSEEKIVDTKWSTKVKQKVEDISDEEKIKYILGLDKALVEQDFGENLVTRTLILEMQYDKKYIINSEGSKVQSDKNLISFYTFNTAKGAVGTEQRFAGNASTKGWEWFKEDKIEEKLIEDNRALVKTAFNAKEMKLGTVDVIVSGEVSGIIAHENTGHPSEGDRILGREGAQAGESFYIDLLKDGKIGEIKIGTEAVTLIDDPSIPNSAGYYLYDDECVKARPRYLIKNGMMNELLLNREYAYKFNTKSNAAARAMGYDREPIVRMANTYFAPGEYEFEELFEDVKKGIYMKSFTEWNIDDRRFQSKYVGLEVYLIEDGILTDKMVRRPTLELTTFGLFGSVDAVAKGYEAPYGTCGKGDPGQGAPVTMGGAEVRMRNIRLGGKQ